MKRFLAMALALVMVFSMMSMTATAEGTEAASGACGDNLTWVLDSNGTLTVSGTGPMTSSPWREDPYSALEIKAVVIENGVTSICANAFQGYKTLTSVTFPASSQTQTGDWDWNIKALSNTLTSIGDNAFRNCTGLTEIVLPPSVTVLGASIFYGCTRLKEVTFTGDAPTFKWNTFNNLVATAYYPGTNLTWGGPNLINYYGHITWVPVYKGIASGWTGANQWVITDDGVLTVYGKGNMKNYGYNGNQPWLAYADQITAVVVQNGVTAIGTGAFMNLTKVEKVNLPVSNLKTIGEAAFYGCTSLKGVNIPEGIYTIWNYTFKNCSSLSYVIMPTSLIKIDQGAFENCTSMTSVRIPTRVDIIGAWSFKGCTGLKEAHIYSPNASEIREGTFKNCTSLTTVTFHEGVKKLGDSAFYGIGATSFTIPASITEVGPWCFARAYSLTDVYFEGDAPLIGEGAFNKLTLTAHYPGDNPTWVEEIMLGYGGAVAWEAK